MIRDAIIATLRRFWHRHGKLITVIAWGWAMFILGWMLAAWKKARDVVKSR